VRVRAVQARSGQARSGQAKSGQATPGQAEPGRPGPDTTRGPAARVRAAGVAIAAVLLVVSLALYAAEVASTRHFHALTWFDLNVYNDAALVARAHPGTLYSWQLKPGIKFTYTPFAALIFAATSLLNLHLLHVLMTLASIAALPVVAWLVLRELGWHDEDRLAGTLAVAAVALWTEPVMRELQLGQVDLLLMLLIVWDLGQSDRRWWKGAGVGVAGAIMLVPLIFIPYLALCGRIRQAVTATVTVAITIVLGFALLPHASAHYWLTGYFLHAGNVGDVASLENQSLLAMLARGLGSVHTATPVWLPLAVVAAVAGLGAGAVLHRRGRPVAGWATCAVTALLVSPISWDHMWVWIVPVVIVLVDRAVRAQGPARWAWGAAAIIATGLYGNWPYAWSGKDAFLTYYGLLSFFRHPHPVNEVYQLHGVQIITWNLFVVCGLVMLAAAIVAAVRSWKPRESVEAPGGNSPHPA
jgi:alpha-1,2-mannosyltransferase